VRRSKTLLAAVAAPLALAAPAAAHDVAGGHGAGGYTVQANEVTRGPVPYATQNAFLPASIKVHVGDTVTWTTTHGHTVTFLGKLKPQQLPFVMPDPPGRPTRASRRGRSAVPLQRHAEVHLQRQIFGPIGSDVVRDRSGCTTGSCSARDRRSPAGRRTASPSRASTSTSACSTRHGRRRPRRPEGCEDPVARRCARRGEADRAAKLARARKLDKVKPPANTILAGVGDTTTLIAFKPSVLTVKAGTTVRIVSGSSTEFHNVVLGPVEYLKTFFRETALFPEGPGSPNQVSPVDVYGSDPERPQIHTGTNHGNGFFVTPVVDKAKYTPLPSNSEVTFTTPGTYTYYCGVHFPDMKGTIVVTP
jgi:plastocyanin